jgi:transposase-like protein
MINESIQKRQEAERKLVMDQLRKIPIVQLACERSGVSRSTYYRWRRENPEFRKESDEAMKDGEELINDLSESQLIALIKEKSFPAIQLWLRQHHQKYGNKLDVRATIVNEDPLTPEQEALIKEALGITHIEKPKQHGTTQS